MRVARPVICLALAGLSVLATACSPAASNAPAASSLVATASPSVAVTTPVPSAAPSASPTPAGPTSFSSPLYRYSITLPAGWTSVASMVAWDGVSMPGHEDASVDLFSPSVGSVAIWAFAGPVALDLAGFTKDRIVANHRDHGDTCPPPLPEVTQPIKIDGQPGTFLAWNCGILINLAITVHGGIGYVFAMRDMSVHAATDPTDRAILMSIVESAHLPG